MTFGVPVSFNNIHADDSQHWQILLDIGCGLVFEWMLHMDISHGVIAFGHAIVCLGGKFVPYADVQAQNSNLDEHDALMTG